MELDKGDRRVQYYIAFSVSVASVTAGCFASWAAPVLPKFQDNQTKINITNDEIAWMLSMSSPGFVSGSLLSRYVADRFGRRPSILGSALPAIVGTIIVATASRAWWLFITKFLWGFATGLLITVTSAYLSEIASKDIRGRLGLVTRYMFNFGNLLMMCIGPFVSYDLLNYLLLVLPVLSFIICWWIPESPYYSLKEGKVEASRKVLMKIRRYKDDKVLEDELLQMQRDVKNEMRHSGSVRELFTNMKYRKALIISSGLKFFQIMAGQLIIQQYLGNITKESGTDMNLKTMFIIFGIVRFVVGVISSYLADKLGRLPLLIYSYIGTGISLCIVGVYFFLLESDFIDHETLKSYSIISFIGIIMSTIISSLGFQTIISLVPSELFPMNVKAVAMTTISLSGGFLNFFPTRGYQMMKDLTGLYGVFWIFGVFSIAGGIFSALYVPETKGKSLREIQIELQGDMYENDDEIEKLNEDAPEIEDAEEKGEFSCKINENV